MSNKKRLWLPTRTSRKIEFQSGSDYYANGFSWTVQSMGYGRYCVQCHLQFLGIACSEVDPPEFGTWREIRHLVEPDDTHDFDARLFLLRVGDVKALQDEDLLPWETEAIEASDFAKTRLGKRFLALHSYVVKVGEDEDVARERALKARAGKTIASYLLESFESELEALEAKDRALQAYETWDAASKAVKAKFLKSVEEAIKAGNARHEDIPLYRHGKAGHRGSEVTQALCRYEERFGVAVPSWVTKERRVTQLALCRLSLNEGFPLPEAR